MGPGVHVMIASFGKQFHLTAAEWNRKAHPTIHTTFVYFLRLQDLVGRNVHWKEKSKERVKAGHSGDGWSCELDGSMVKAPASDDIRVETVRRRKVNDRVECE